MSYCPRCIKLISHSSVCEPVFFFLNFTRFEQDDEKPIGASAPGGLWATVQRHLHQSAGSGLKAAALCFIMNNFLLSRLGGKVAFDRALTHSASSDPPEGI